MGLSVFSCTQYSLYLRCCPGRFHTLDKMFIFSFLLMKSPGHPNEQRAFDITIETEVFIACTIVPFKSFVRDVCINQVNTSRHQQHQHHPRTAEHPMLHGTTYSLAAEEKTNLICLLM